ncbi:nuclear factor erythroid 2-related factor 2a isoform X2 [Genypterus blacodes]|uniref:nuclear factor erythroid 2-related factor 2a isoform X2 n=1 Tax=Genypterus blacodes TaxID=154954 RepID=UPI003F774B2C
MMMEMKVPSQQDMDLIDILWRQDIDLGARREVFDYNHRQKEHELQRQRELEEEKRRQLLRDEEKALLAQLQLDEETGEYIPRPPPSAPLQSTPTPLEGSQNVRFTEEDAAALSFDECLQLLAETFPVEQDENAPVCQDTAAASAPSSNIMMSPEQPALPQAPLPPDPLQPQRMSPDLEQAWMELLSLPELQCLNMQMEDTLETTTYPLTASPEVQDPNYPFYSLSSLTDAGPNTEDVCPTEFVNTFDSFPRVPPPDNLGHVEATAPQLHTNLSEEAFCEAFYPNPILSSDERGGPCGLDGNGNDNMSEIPHTPPFKPGEAHSLSSGDTIEMHKELTELLDSDSGISLNTSPNASSPEKSVYGDGSFDYSDSDLEEMDQNPGSAESDYSEMFCLNFQLDDLPPAGSMSIQIGQPQQLQDKNPKHHKAELAEENGHHSAPFTKDKQKKRSEVRLSRDEQRAKALKIPFTVDMIINLPVDDFNEMMSKHQLNEAQLALVRDIRRRGKNKVAAQNCRKRKMENIVGLESDLGSLMDEKDRLLSEKRENISTLREMKHQLSTLYLEVFSMLRDENGKPYSPSNYSLQQSTEGSIFLVPRIKKTLIKREDD